MSSRLERAKNVDLVTLPRDVEGTNCGNCRFSRDGYCTHKEVDQPINPRMCCAEWDAEGTKRAWEVKKNEPLEIEETKEEIRTTPLPVIQRKTARKWAARAIVSYMFAEEADNNDDLFNRFVEGDDYRHEAIEHASQIKDPGDFVNFIHDQIDKARDKVDLSPLGIEKLGKHDSLALIGGRLCKSGMAGGTSANGTQPTSGIPGWSGTGYSMAASEPKLTKSPYGPKGFDLYSDADNARRKMHRGSLSTNKPTATQQASSMAADDKARSKKNPVKIYTRSEIKKLMRERFKLKKDFTINF